MLQNAFRKTIITHSWYSGATSDISVTVTSEGDLLITTFDNVEKTECMSILIDNPHEVLDLLTHAVKVWDNEQARIEGERQAREDKQAERDEYQARYGGDEHHHHVDCQCNLCTYDTAAINPLEY